MVEVDIKGSVDELAETVCICAGKAKFETYDAIG